MTVKKLHKLLGKFIERGHGRREVLVSKTSFTHALESDGCTMLPVVSVFGQWIPNIDDDGGQKFNKDGSESGKGAIILEGNEPPQEFETQNEPTP